MSFFLKYIQNQSALGNVIFMSLASSLAATASTNIIRIAIEIIRTVY